VLQRGLATGGGGAVKHALWRLAGGWESLEEHGPSRFMSYLQVFDLVQGTERGGLAWGTCEVQGKQQLLHFACFQGERVGRFVLFRGSAS
jgi:hypothetical protein